jgi:site-specific recombinase XerD
MTTIIDTIPDFMFELLHHKKVVPETLNNYRQTFFDFCNLYGLKETKRINASHILKYRNHISKRNTRRKSQTG